MVVGLVLLPSNAQLPASTLLFASSLVGAVMLPESVPPIAPPSVSVTDVVEVFVKLPEALIAPVVPYSAPLLLNVKLRLVVKAAKAGRAPPLNVTPPAALPSATSAFTATVPLPRTVPPV